MACYMLFAYQQLSDCDFLRVVCLNSRETGIYDLHVSLKAEGLGVNCSNVTTSSDVSLQTYTSLQSLTSGGLIHNSCH